jgi:hypothetical protein
VGKNSSMEGYLALVQLMSEHLSIGLLAGLFEVHNKIRRSENVMRYLKQCREEKEPFLAEAVAAPAQTPAYICCLGSHGKKPPCAEKLNHAFKEVDLAVDDAIVEDPTAVPPPAEAGDGRYLDLDSQSAHSRSNLGGKYDLANDSETGEGGSIEANAASPSLIQNAPRYAVSAPWEASLGELRKGYHMEKALTVGMRECRLMTYLTLPFWRN